MADGIAEILKAITQTLKGCARETSVSSDCQSEESRASLTAGKEKHAISLLSDRLFFTDRTCINQECHCMIVNISVKTEHSYYDI